MSNEPEKIGVDVWIAATIYVDADTEEEAAQIVGARYAGTREDPDTYNHMNGEDLPLDGDDFMSSAITLYGLCAHSALAPATDGVPHALHALKVAEEFISGFEGDELQEAIDDKLATIRAAIAGTAHDAVRDATVDLLAQLKFAVARVKLANTEGDPILSAWLPGAEHAIAKSEGRA